MLYKELASYSVFLQAPIPRTWWNFKRPQQSCHLSAFCGAGIEVPSSKSHLHFVNMYRYHSWDGKREGCVSNQNLLQCLLSENKQHVIANVSSLLY
ncbi:hypothetical protein JTE90_024924 [Oedothorax gibbosus]|uniref:Uncharacterized protein n=1 Tax=Oedothorax gibbosus TaxID=931172 RepID=A0AAV6TXP8_9ARAC|nr:hypothetical protein JTE90_024924 [Oedothorax gibbosus]